MKEPSEAEKFDNAMNKLLKVPPQVVRDAMAQEKLRRAEERKAKHAPDARAVDDRKT